MINRRNVLKAGSLAVMAGALPHTLRAANAKRVLLVHGRSQQRQDPATLKATWVDALKRGAAAAGKTIPADVEFAFPYYGDTLDRFTREATIPLTSDVTSRGSQKDDEFLAFQAELAEAIRMGSGVTDDQVDREYGSNPHPRGPLNWEWVQAILRAVDKYGGGMGQRTLETFTRDVFLYSTLPVVRDAIDQIVTAQLTTDPTVVVAHSLGTVVSYSVLRRDTRSLHIPAFVTVGSPLGLRAVRDQFRPLKYPQVDGWYNAFDTRDVVALYPLDTTNFPVVPAVENNGTIKNRTANRHGIDGYLDDASIAKKILDALGTAP
jgi:hypothetical protein